MSETPSTERDRWLALIVLCLITPSLVLAPLVVAALFAALRLIATARVTPASLPVFVRLVTAPAAAFAILAQPLRFGVVRVTQ